MSYRRYEKMGTDGQIYEGTIKDFDGFSVEDDCTALREAMKGLGTDEDAIIEILAQRSVDQRLEIKKAYKTMFGKDLFENIESELSGDFRKAVTMSLYDPDFYDAHSIHEAIKGAGTKENVLTEILTSRSNEQIENIKDLYKKHFGNVLEEDVASDTSGFYKRILVSCLQANKNELNDDEIELLYSDGPGAIISVNQAAEEAAELYDAGEGQLGTDEVVFLKVFAMRNPYQLQATFREYEKLAGKTIIEAIESETSGDTESALKALAKLAIDRTNYFAERIYKTMKGAGTDDDDLIRLIITRSEIDLANIKEAFEEAYGQTLEQFIEDDTSGDYKKFLLKLVQGN